MLIFYTTFIVALRKVGYISINQSINFTLESMGISKNGLHGETTGKVGNLVYYNRLGKPIVRTIGQTLKPPTIRQLNCRQQLSVTSAVCSDMLGFINVSYSMRIIGTDKSAYNEAMKYNKKNATVGYYPDVELDFGKLLVSEGLLLQAINPAVVASAEGLVYSWDTDPQLPWPEYTDQVMMLAYFPELRLCKYVLFGAMRQLGTDILPLDIELQGAYMETYISFISANRKEVATSQYTGSINA